MKVLGTVLLAVATLTAATPARAHAIDLADAKRLVEERARVVAENMRAEFMEIRTGELRVELAVSCRRSGEHRARCAWRAAVFSDYRGYEEEPVLAMVCTGRASVRLSGARLRAAVATAACVH